jgi:HK97 gp10 family phage protein
MANGRNKYILGTSKRIPPGHNTVTMSVDASGFHKLMGDLVDAAAEAVRPAAQAGAQVFYDRAVANVNGLAHAPLKVAALGSKTGNLKGSIYQVYSKTKSTEGEQATYHISWNARKAPHGHLVEYGHIMRYRTFVATKGPKKGQWVTDKKHPIAAKQVAAHPFMRPAFWAGEDAAKEAMTNELMRRIQEAAK